MISAQPQKSIPLSPRVAFGKKPYLDHSRGDELLAGGLRCQEALLHPNDIG
jgi:hypothetical protein